MNSGVASCTDGPSAGARHAATSAAKSVTGNVVDTRYGPIQVRITVKNGKITAVTATASAYLGGSLDTLPAATTAD